MDMTTPLAGTWVEIQELGDGKRSVFKRIEADIPPSRGGRRQLVLSGQEGGGVRTRGLGPTDRTEDKGSGAWRVDGKVLVLDVEGWEGAYDIEELSDDTLILQGR
ncbi:MAG: hypothetical protein AAGH83_00580 [Pseudomonadota bacterium]